MFHHTNTHKIRTTARKDISIYIFTLISSCQTTGSSCVDAMENSAKLCENEDMQWKYINMTEIHAIQGCVCVVCPFFIRIHFHFFLEYFLILCCTVVQLISSLSVGRFRVKIIKNLHNINFPGNLTATQSSLSLSTNHHYYKPEAKYHTQ